MSVSSFSSPPPSPQAAPLPFASSCVTFCPELELSNSLNLTPDAKRPQPRPQRHNHETNQTQPRLNAQQLTSRKNITKELVVISPPLEAQQPIRSQRWNRECHAFQPSSKLHAATSNLDPSGLEKAELNTTLALKAEFLTLQEEEFDSKKAVKETLQKSERTKNLINAKATEVVNVSRSQQLFTSLVSVSVHEDQLINQVVHDRLLLAPPSYTPTVALTTEAPSPLVFMTSIQPRQKPLPEEEEPTARQPCPTARPAFFTFDLHRRQRCWEAAP